MVHIVFERLRHQAMEDFRSTRHHFAERSEILNKSYEYKCIQSSTSPDMNNRLSFSTSNNLAGCNHDTR